MHQMPYIPTRLAGLITASIQPLLPAARLWVLSDYRRARLNRVTPITALTAIRDRAAIAYMNDLIRAIDPPLEQAARYAAAAGYIETLWERQQPWWRAP